MRASFACTPQTARDPSTSVGMTDGRTRFPRVGAAAFAQAAAHISVDSTAGEVQLPFTNMSDDPQQEFFGDGITDAA